jgi:hypothetical protein
VKRLDLYLWKLTYTLAVFSHGKKATRPVFAQYLGRFNKSRQDRWVFGDRDGGAYLHKFAKPSIVRHQVVKGGASPDDPALRDYWASRQRKAPTPVSSTIVRLGIVVRRKEPDRILDGGRPPVIERSRNHDDALAAAPTAATMLW